MIMISAGLFGPNGICSTQVHLYEHIHEHHHYFYRPEQGQVKETPITEEVRPEEGPVTEQMVTVETRLERRRSTVERSNAPKRRASKAEEAEPMTIPRIVVEQVDGPPSSSQSQTDLEDRSVSLCPA